jgi:predicted amidohydrolase
MDAQPAPTPERLALAEKLVVECAQAGAQLVVLPEVFNTGYVYNDANYLRAETLDGPTASWMKNTAAKYQIHLAGSFLRRQKHDIFNTLLLAAPDGGQWQYDKQAPWMWERAYFQKGSQPVIAETVLGKIGFLICWDVAHPALWRQYAGQVDLMLIASCPPRVLDMTLIFPDGQRLRAAKAGALIQYLKRSTDETFGLFLRRQSAWLGVPMLNATGTGVFSSGLPAPGRWLSMIVLMVPRLWRHRSGFEQTRVETSYFNETIICDASGEVQQRLHSDSNGSVVSLVSLGETPAQPTQKQPQFGIPTFTYWLDALVNRMLEAEYHRKTRKYLGHG